MPEELAIGLDIGGTKMAFAVVNRRGRILDHRSLPTSSGDSLDRTLDRIASQLGQLLAAHESCAAIGIGVPGPVDSDRGLALNAVNLNWRELHLRGELAQRLAQPLPIYVDNDVNVGAIGEMLFGAAANMTDFVYLAIGTGLGGAAVSKGTLLRGATHSEMEIGHVSIDPVKGRPCSCGLRGCLEMSISGKGLVAIAREHIQDFPQSGLSMGDLTTQAIIRCADQGDPLASFVVRQAATALGVACAWCINLFNPESIVLGGGLIHALFHLLEEDMREALQVRCLPGSLEYTDIILSQHADAALGAAALVWYHRQKEADK